MVFTTIPFFFFLVIVLGTYWMLREDRWRHPFLLFANFFFYGWWDWRFIALLALVIFIAYIGGELIEEERNASSRKYWMILTCTFLLGVLAYFKYTNFFLASLRDLMQQMGGHVAWTTLKIILPAGISFYIFQAISYVVTIYRRKLVAEKSIIKLGVYLSFFPHLVAGPIIHAPTFLPQLAEKRFFHPAFFVEGARKFALGFLYKAVFADHLAAVVNPIFETLSQQTPLLLFGGCLGFYGQIYFDFAGYSLMAIGVANLLGYTLPDNFNFPYRASSLIDFWHRWHISLSTWLRDYLYIPLGGNRCSMPRNYANIMVTMLLGGLWHGASWNFLWWGGMHGATLCVNHFWRRVAPKKIVVPKFIGWILTQFIVFCCWIPFRAATLHDTIWIFQQLGKGVIMLIDLMPAAFSSAAISFPWLLVILPLFFDMVFNGNQAWRERCSIHSTTLFYGIIIIALLIGLLFMPSGTVPFIYFQF